MISNNQKANRTMSATKPRRESARQIEKRRATEGAKLRTMIESYVSAHGGGKGKYREWDIPTTLGTLEVDVVNDWIACRWDDVRRAVAHFGTNGLLLNPYSGKWNWGCGERLTAIELFTQWERAMASLVVVNSQL